MRIVLLCIFSLIFTANGFAQSTAPTTAPQTAVPVARVDESKYTVEGNIAYGSHPMQKLDMIYPKGAGPGSATKLPGVVMFHGGGWIQTNKATMSSFYNRFLEHGFVVCNVEYRMATRGRDGAYTADSAVAPAAVEDALLAAKWFWDHAEHYNVDRARFIVTGASAGGHLALMVGLATPEAKLGPTSPGDFKLAAIVNGYGTSDVADNLSKNDGAAKQWIPDTVPDRDALIKRVSPISYVRKEIPPLLTVIGARDPEIAPNKKLIEQLQSVGADAQIHIVEGAGHGFTMPTTWPDAEKAIFDFLSQKGIIKP
jgi:acetyl esterase/lipase